MNARRDAVPRLDSTSRTALVWLHLLCASAAGFALLSREPIDLSVLMSGARLVGAHGAIFALPAMWPYIASLVISRSFPCRRAYLGIYSGLLLVSTAASVWVLLVVSAANLIGSVLVVSFAQTGAFIWVSDRIEEYEDAHHRDV
jgi:hypothetical protein